MWERKTPGSHWRTQLDRTEKQRWYRSETETILKADATDVANGFESAARLIGLFLSIVLTSLTLAQDLETYVAGEIMLTTTQSEIVGVGVILIIVSVAGSAVHCRYLKPFWWRRSVKTWPYVTIICVGFFMAGAALSHA